jgi:hypothetical protein
VAPGTTPRRTPALAQAARYFGALMLLGTGTIHLEQYFAVYYQVIPVIGPLFAANFALAVILGLSLLAPAERRFGDLGRALLALAALGGIGFSIGTLVGLELSEFGALFGFHEHGYRALIILSIAFEGAAIVSLAAYLGLLARSRPATPRHRRAVSTAPGAS